MTTNGVLAFILFESCFILLCVSDTRNNTLERFICRLNAAVCFVVGLLLMLRG